MQFSLDEFKRLAPDWYETELGENVEMRNILEAEGSVFQDVTDKANQINDNSLVMFCDEQSLSLYEDMFRIAPNPLDTLEIRRERVLLKLRLRRPFTQDYLIRQADALIGRGNYTITVVPRSYEFFLEYVESFNNQWVPEMNKIVLVTLPANLIYIIKLNYSDGLELAEKPTLTVTNIQYFRVSDEATGFDSTSRLGDMLERPYNEREEDIIDGS